MKYRHLGKAGIQVSELSLGSWLTFADKSAIDTTTELMAAAYDAGVNFFDNAEVYVDGKAEEIMGAVLKKLGWRRGSYLVSTKLFWGLHAGPNEQNTLNRKYLLESVTGSLRRLGLDYVDLLFCHRPDTSTPIEETVWAMHNIVERGQAIYWGTSEWSAADVLMAIEVAERHHLHKPVVEQPVYNLLKRHRFGPDYRPVYEDRGYGSTIFSPLASGLLTGKYQDGIPADSRGAQHDFDWLKYELTNRDHLRKVAALRPVAEQMGASLAQFSLAWCLQNPWVSTVMTGATSVKQIQENMQAIEFVDRFSPEVMAEIERILK
ncbi:MAG: aldo/keto reductase [Proteobacteria bacterium]|nr:aldo/keto reductase [Pseudomonadota bacterium]MDA1064761.1 aldo/keto reductase [Pseudomonadota bacterium]